MSHGQGLRISVGENRISLTAKPILNLLLSLVWNITAAIMVSLEPGVLYCGRICGFVLGKLWGESRDASLNNVIFAE